MKSRLVKTIVAEIKSRNNTKKQNKKIKKYINGNKIVLRWEMESLSQSLKSAFEHGKPQQCALNQNISQNFPTLKHKNWFCCGNCMRVC